MGSVCRSKRIIDIHVAERCEGLGKGFVVLLFSGMETKILEQHDVAHFHLRDEIFDVRTDAVRRKDHVLSQQSAQPFGNRREAEFWVELAFWPAEVRTQNGFAAVVNYAVDGWKGGTDTGVVGNLEGIVQRDIKVCADDDPLAGQGHVVDRLLMQIHGDPYWSA